jgi:hypothetical protein
MFKKLAILDTVALEPEEMMPGGPMIALKMPEQAPTPQPAPEQPMQAPGAPLHSAPDAPPPNGLPAVSDLNPQTAVAWRKLKVSR